MTTPAIMLLLMVTPWLLVRASSAMRHRSMNGHGAASIGLGFVFVFTGIGHFMLTESMALMLPPWVPQKTLLVHASGVLELVIAGGFFVPRFRRLAGWAAVVVLIGFFPLNVYAAMHYVPMGGHAWGPSYLLVRAPLQIAILSWVWWFTIRKPTDTITRNPAQAETAG